MLKEHSHDTLCVRAFLISVRTSPPMACSYPTLIFRDRLFLVVCAFASVLFASGGYLRWKKIGKITAKRKHPQDAQPHQRCVKGDLGFSPTSRNRAVFSLEKIARFAERVPHGIACNSLVSFCSQLCFDRCRFVINKNFSKNNSSFPVRQKGSSATVLWKHGKAGCGIGNLSYKPKTSV